MRSILRCKISSDISDLNELHRQYWWIPNESMIRPSQKVLEEKYAFSEYVLANWMSFRDFILDTQFKYKTDVDDGHIYIYNEVKKSEWIFRESLFPYELAANVNHFILWNSLYDYFVDVDDLTITSLIEENLKKIVGSDEFDFAWYKNPKPSIPDLLHCQVFWITTT
jgi:hypothetical protein